VSLPCSSSADPLSGYCIGLKLRTLRTAKHLTLTRLAAQTGYSTALLSKLETDRMVPTLQTLERICRVYGIGLGHFFCEPLHHSVSITRREHAIGGREHPLAHFTPLNVATCDGLLASQIVELPAGVSTTTGECGSITETTAYVLEGTLHVCAAGTCEALEPGDSIVLSTDQVIVWSAASQAACRLLSVSAKRASKPNSQMQKV
jgi:transcriptional regulator with XRE-family HTH domain